MKEDPDLLTKQEREQLMQAIKLMNRRQRRAFSSEKRKGKDVVKAFKVAMRLT